MKPYKWIEDKSINLEDAQDFINEHLPFSLNYTKKIARNSNMLIPDICMTASLDGIFSAYLFKEKYKIFNREKIKGIVAKFSYYALMYFKVYFGISCVKKNMHNFPVFTPLDTLEFYPSGGNLIQEKIYEKNIEHIKNELDPIQNKILEMRLEGRSLVEISILLDLTKICVTKKMKFIKKKVNIFFSEPNSICEFCENRFYSTSKKIKFCSESCKKNSRFLYMKNYSKNYYQEKRNNGS